MRRAEPARLVGNPAKAKRLLDWTPQTTFHELIREMTLAEIKAAETGTDSIT
jgi:GDPmannose 4,6-dehydratase